MVEQAQRAAVVEYPDSLDAIEECYRRGWTDGLPVVPPTADRVQAMLDAVGLAPDTVLGEVEVRRRTLTAEQAAANAVMAGCLPSYFPVVLATMKALFEFDPNCIHEVSAVTNSTGLLTIVNGPIRREIELNCADNLFQPRLPGQCHHRARAPLDLHQRVRAASGRPGPRLHGELDQVRRSIWRG